MRVHIHECMCVCPRMYVCVCVHMPSSVYMEGKDQPTLGIFFSIDLLVMETGYFTETGAHLIG